MGRRALRGISAVAVVMLPDPKGEADLLCRELPMACAERWLFRFFQRVNSVDWTLAPYARAVL